MPRSKNISAIINTEFTVPKHWPSTVRNRGSSDFGGKSGKTNFLVWEPTESPPPNRIKWVYTPNIGMKGVDGKTMRIGCNLMQCSIASVPLDSAFYPARLKDHHSNAFWSIVWVIESCINMMVELLETNVWVLLDCQSGLTEEDPIRIKVSPLLNFQCISIIVVTDVCINIA